MCVCVCGGGGGGGVTGLDLQGEISLQSQNLPHFFSLWVFPPDKSPLIEVRISKFGPKMHLSTVKVPSNSGIDWPWFSFLFFLFQTIYFLYKFCVSYSFPSFYIYLVRPSPVSVPHPTWHCAYSNSPECGQGPPWTMKQSTFISWWDHWSFSQPQLGNRHWILQAAISFRYIIYALHVEILYANFN